MHDSGITGSCWSRLSKRNNCRRARAEDTDRDMDFNDLFATEETECRDEVSAAEPPRRTVLARFFAALGPGLIAGAADDDPSGIATYSAAGALLGTAQLWTALITWPLIAAAQMMCARIAIATGSGLAAALRQKLPKSVVVIAAL